MIHVSEGEMEIIVKILKNRLREGEVWAYGSRYRGNHWKHSDLDLAVLGAEKMPPAVCAGIKGDFMESRLPYRVDILDYHAVPQHFREVIDEGHEVIFKAEV